MPGDRLLKSLIWTYGKNYTIQFAHLGTLLDLKPLLRGLFSCPGHVSLGGGGCPSSALLLMCYGTKWHGAMVHQQGGGGLANSSH